MKSSDKKYIKTVNLWASNIIDQIKSNEDFNESMLRQINRNKTIISNDKDQLIDGLEDHNKWLKENKYPTLKKFLYIK